MGFQPLLKSISLKLNIMARLEFELAQFEDAVQPLYYDDPLTYTKGNQRKKI